MPLPTNPNHDDDTQDPFKSIPLHEGIYTTAELKDELLKERIHAIRTIKELMNNPSSPPAVKQRCAEQILELTHGKDKQEFRENATTIDAIAQIRALVDMAKQYGPD